jgi:predicted dehydrogenase
MNDSPKSSSPITAPNSVRRGTAVALAGGLTLARAVHASASDELKIALVGCGGRGTGAAAQALSTQGPVKLWAMADAFEDRLQNSLKQLTAGGNVSRGTAEGLAAKIDVPPERRFIGLDAYRHAIDCGVDVVLLTTPPGFRPVQFEYAVGQGKHVFMEKPVAVDAPGIRRVLAAAEEAKQKGLKVGVGLHRRHDRVYQETIDRVQQGAIGEVRLLGAYSNRAGTAKYLKRTPEMTEMQYQVGHWYYFTWLSGDFIVEQSIHMIDVCNWAKGGFPVTAQGQGGRQVRTGADYGHIYDHHAVEYTYADGAKLFSQNRHIPGCWNIIAHHGWGTKGHAQFGEGLIEGATPWRMREKPPNAYQVEHDVLFEAIRNDRPHNEAVYGAKSTMTAILGRMATYSGKEVTWDEAFNSTLDLSPSDYTWDATPSILPDANGVYPAAMPGVTKAL